MIWKINIYIWCMIAPFETTKVRQYLTKENFIHTFLEWLIIEKLSLIRLFLKKKVLLAHWCEYLQRSWTLLQFYLLLIWITYFFCYAKLPTCDFQKTLSFPVFPESQLNWLTISNTSQSKFFINLDRVRGAVSRLNIFMFHSIWCHISHLGVSINFVTSAALICPIPAVLP